MARNSIMVKVFFILYPCVNFMSQKWLKLDTYINFYLLCSYFLVVNVEFTGNFGAQRKRFPVKFFVERSRYAADVLSILL